MFNMFPVAERRQRPEEDTGRRGDERKAISFQEEEKKRAIIRVCQLRVIVWLVESFLPPVSFYGRCAF
jgi:hypothetical protein